MGGIYYKCKYNEFIFTKLLSTLAYLFELSFALKIGALSLAKMYTVTTTYLHENEMNLEIGLKNFLPKER